MDEERLIEVVQLYNCLWDPGNKDYSNRTLKEKIWMEIAHILSVPALECKTKWKKLKDARSAAIKRKKGKSGQAYKFIKVYKYETMMSFLDDIGEDTETYSNLDSMEPNVSTQQPAYSIEELIDHDDHNDHNDHDYTQSQQLYDYQCTTETVTETETIPLDVIPRSPRTAPSRCSTLTQDPVVRPSTSFGTGTPRTAPSRCSTLTQDPVVRPSTSFGTGTPRTAPSRCSTQTQDPVVRPSTSNERNRRRDAIIRQRLESLSDQASPAPRPPPLTPPTNAAGAPSRRSRAPDNISQAILQELQKTPEDVHAHFGMAVAEMMRTLSAELASELRIKIFQIIHDATF